MHWNAVFVFLSLAMASTQTAAQVHRCKDAMGKTIYTDAPCAPGQAGVLIEQQKSPMEIQRERAQAAEAIERKYRERAAEQQTRLPPSSPTPVVRREAPQDKSSSRECLQAQRDHETISSTRTGTAEERRNRINSATMKVNSACGLQTEMIQPPARIIPLNITNCNGGFCYDDRGGVYHRNGPDFMTGPNGTVCHRVGRMWNCS